MKREQAKPPNKLNQLLEFLSCHFDRYPFDERKDSRYFKLLIEEFGDLNIDQELKQYYAWTLDQPDRKKIHYRSRFRSWLKTAREYQSQSSLAVKKGGFSHAQSRW